MRTDSESNMTTVMPHERLGDERRSSVRSNELDMRRSSINFSKYLEFWTLPFVSKAQGKRLFRPFRFNICESPAHFIFVPNLNLPNVVTESPRHSPKMYVLFSKKYNHHANLQYAESLS